MRVVLTGSSGRIGRAIHAALSAGEAPDGSPYDIVSIDRSPFSTTNIVGDIADADLVARALDGADAVIHAAALHAPHVGLVDDATFARVNVEATRRLAEAAVRAGCAAFVFTSTTALYGDAVRDGRCTWIDEATPPQPLTIYHRTKVDAEKTLEGIAGIAIRVIRMSRCFPQPAPAMAVQRLHRGVDARDVADAHVAALSVGGAAFQRFVVSGATPFTRDDLDALAADAPAVLARLAPALVDAFARRGWSLPRTIDRVYVPTHAEATLPWRARHGFDEVLAQLDRRSLEVLPAGANVARAAE